MALALAWLTGALLVVGALVTTYRVGMAVTDWPTTFGYSMFAYPLDQMMEDFGVTVEHSHRLLASIVGLLSLVLVLVAAAGTTGRIIALSGLAATAEVLLVFDVIRIGGVGGPVQLALLTALATLLIVALVPAPRRGPRAIAACIHLGVIGQGLLGGTRVLENSQNLAFLHGSVAQLVFLMMAMSVVICAPRFQGAAPISAAREAGRGVAALAWATTALVYGQIVLGAWLRHTGRDIPLMLHLGFAFAAVGAVLMLANRLQAAAQQFEAERAAPLLRVRKQLLSLLLLQVMLGVASLAAIVLVSGGFKGRVTTLEAVTASAHVLTGALLLGSCAAAGLWSGRLFRMTRASEVPEVRTTTALEGVVA